jgi:hypothetical protein
MTRQTDTFVVQVRSSPPQRYAGVRRRVTVDALDAFIAEATQTLQRARRASGPSFAIFNGPVDVGRDGPVEVGIPAETGERAVKVGSLGVDRLPRLLLGAEGIAVAATSVALYFHAGYPWWLFVVLALAPDLSMVGYAAGTRVGAACYNAAHTYAGPVVLGATGVITGADAAIEAALIWLTHIGVDRALGYGLKYATAFKETHLQRV